MSPRNPVTALSAAATWRAGRALPLALAVASCAAGPSAVDPAILAFNGVYEGTSTPAAADLECGGVARRIRIEVAAGHVWVHAHHHRHHLDGTVNVNGQFVMQDDDAGARVTGVIQNDRLTGIQTGGGRRHEATHLFSDGSAVCSARIEASRSSDQASGTPEK